MGMIGKGILAAFWLVLVPLLGGVPFFHKNNKERIFPGDCLAAGYALLLGFFEVLTLPMILLSFPLHVLTAVYGIGAVFLALFGAVCLYRRRKSGIIRSSDAAKSKISGFLPMLAAIVLIALQIVVLVRYGHLDADDSFYVGTATTAVETDTIFSVNPYTGDAYKSLPSRYVLSPFPVFLAVASNLSGGLHPAIMAHTLFPAVFVAFGYVVLLLFARLFFPGKRASQGTFLLVAASAIWFSGYSIYNSGNFEMVRIWQGKALLAGVFLPLLLYWCMTVVLEETPRYPRILLFGGNLSCCLLSSMGILLAPLLMGICLSLSFVKYRSLKKMVLDFGCLLPSLALGGIYIWIR